MLDAAEEIFADVPYRTASMDEIAAASGITKALLYQYFESKEGLYVACVDRARKRLFARLTDAAALARGPRDQLEAVIASFFDYLEEHRAWSFVLYGDLSTVAVNEMRRDNARVLGHLVLRAASADGRWLSRTDVDFIGQLLVGAAEQVARWWIEHPELPKEQARDRLVAACGGAIAAITR